MYRKNHLPIMICSILVIAVMTIIGAVINMNVNQKMKRHCFEQLQRETINLAENLKESVDSDTTILKAMAGILSGNSDMTDADLISIMKAFDDPSSYVSYMEILKPDNTLLIEDGTIVIATGKLDFEEELKKGCYVSDKAESVSNPGEQVIRNAVPVIKDGKAICILYGVISLEEMKENYITHIYDGKAKVFLLDAKTGDYILDTWHNTLGNFSDYQGSRTLDGKSFDQVYQDLQANKPGNIIFKPNTIKETVFMHYEPAHVNNWMVLVLVSEKEGFKENNEVKNILLVMALLENAVLVAYMVFIIKRQVRAFRLIKKMSEEDEITGLLNRNVFEVRIRESKEKTYSKITCIYADVNGLHEINNALGHAIGDQMLQVIANSLKIFFPYQSIYRVGGDEFVILCEDTEQQECEEKIEAVAKMVEEQDYYVSFGISCRENETGLERVIQEADKIMLENKMEFYKIHDRRIRY